MIEKLTWILEGFLLLGLFCMFISDNRGLWSRPRSWGTNDDTHREMRTGR